MDRKYGSLSAGRIGLFLDKSGMPVFICGMQGNASDRRTVALTYGPDIPQKLYTEGEMRKLKKQIKTL